MTATATATVDEAHLVRSFEKVQIAPDRLFDIWTQPKLMQVWLFKTKNNEIRRVEVDLRVGGKFSILEIDKGEEIEHFGEYQVIEKPRRLMFTLQSPKRFAGVSVVSVGITAGDESSWMSLAHTGVEKATMQSQWRQMFMRLRDELA